MKIVIQKAGSLPLFFILPTRLLLNRFCAAIAVQAINAAVNRKCQNIPQPPHVQFTSEQLFALFTELLRLKRKYGRLELINVSAADGSRVFVSL